MGALCCCCPKETSYHMNNESNYQEVSFNLFILKFCVVSLNMFLSFSNRDQSMKVIKEQNWPKLLSSEWSNSKCVVSLAILVELHFGLHMLSCQATWTRIYVGKRLKHSWSKTSTQGNATFSLLYMAPILFSFCTILQYSRQSWQYYKRTLFTLHFFDVITIN